jgi:hypothetical protein
MVNITSVKKRKQSVSKQVIKIYSDEWAKGFGKVLLKEKDKLFIHLLCVFRNNYVFDMRNIKARRMIICEDV